jgi:hypothetical protein
MAAVDPRLFRFTQVARRNLVLSVATAALVIVQAWLLAGLITAAFQEGADLTELRTPMALTPRDTLSIRRGRSTIQNAGRAGETWRSAQAGAHPDRPRRH